MLIKIGLWILLVLCAVVFIWDAYNLVWKNRETGWRAFDLLTMLSAMALAGRLVSWLF